MADQNQSSLTEAISQYEMQLTQIRFAIDATSNGPDRENLMSLQKDIEELINLTKENLKSLQGQIEDGSSTKHTKYIPEDDDDPFAKEYALFKAELASSEGGNDISATEAPYVPVDIQSDLNELQGMKCQAPHSHQWGGDESYHNALVYGVEPSEDITDVTQIQVRVMFTNPTHQEMLPCPYFLEGECRFSEEQCRFSHGELVQLSCLKEYREPDFSVVRQGSRVLVKQSDKLWHRAIITTMHPRNRCDVKFESSRGKAEVDLHDILPMSTDNDGKSESGDSSDGDLSEEEAEVTASLVEQSLLVTPLSTALGSWEEHTRGIGSRLMAQMGYVTGAGLGKYGEGRIEPIEAVVLPAGKSLDHCMALREQAGGDTNLFKVDRRMRRLQRKQDLKREKQYEAEKQRTRTNVFDFINTTLGGKRERVEEVSSLPTTSKASSTEPNPSRPGGTVLKSESSRGLNVVGFQVSEEIRRAERDLAKLQESLARHTEGSVVHKTITSKFQDKQGELSHLRASEKSIDRERNQRSDRKKLSVF